MGEFEDKLNSILSDPEQMDKIAAMAKSFMGGAEETTAPDELFGGGDSGLFDMASLGKISRLISAGKAQNDEKQALFNAMRPYLSEKRREKMDKAIKLAGLARIARLAMGEMGDKDV